MSTAAKPYKMLKYPTVNRGSGIKGFFLGVKSPAGGLGLSFQ